MASLFDSLFNVNRPAMDAYVTQGQSMAGLRSAQTEDALMKAQQAQEQMNASSQLEDAYTKMGMAPSSAHAAATISIGHFGDAKTAMEALQGALKLKNEQTLALPENLGSPAATAAASSIQGKIPTPEAVPGNFTVAPGMPAPNVRQTPEAAAQTENFKAQAAQHTATAAGTSSLSDDAAYNAAVKYNLTGQLPSMGMGQSAAADRKKVLDFAAQQSVNPNWHPPSWDAAAAPGAAPATHPSLANATTPIGAAATTKANTSMLTDMTKRTAIADSSEETANTNLQLALHYLKGADQTGSPLINAVQNKIRSGLFGDPDVSAYTNALTTAANEYARVISMATGATGITDQARAEGQRLFSPGMAPAQLEANIQVAQQEMANRTGSLHSQVAHAKTSLGTPQGAAAPAGAPTAIPLDQYLKSKGF